MKLITAIIDPDKLDGVRESLKKEGMKYMLVIKAKALAAEGGFTERYRGNTYITDYYDFIRVEIVVDDDKLDSSVEAILDVTGQGENAIGKIFTSTIDNAIDIRSRETGSEVVA